MQTFQVISRQIEHFEVSQLRVKRIQNVDGIVGQVKVREVAQPLEMLYRGDLVVTKIDMIDPRHQLLKRSNVWLK